MKTIFLFSNILLSLTSLALVIILLIYGKVKVHRLLTLTNLATFFWGLGTTVVSFTNDKTLMYFAWVVAHIGGYFIPIFFCHALYLFTQNKNKTFLILADLFIILATSLTLFTNFVIPRLRLMFDSIFYPQATISYAIIYITWAFIFAEGNYQLFKFMKKVKGVKLVQAKYLLVASVIGFIGGGSVLWPSFGIKLYPIGNFGATLYIIISTYAILRYRLMDVKVAITRAGLFVVLYTLILGIPFALAVWWKSWLVDIWGANWWMSPLILMAALATCGPFIYIYLDRRAEDKLLAEQRRYQQTLKQASVGMTRIRDLRKLLDLITHIVTRTVKISYAAIYLHNEQDEYVLQVMRDKGRVPVPKINSDNPLVLWIMVKREPLIYEEVKRQMEDTNDATYVHLEENMRLLTAAVIIPSFLEDRFMGFFVLGDKASGQIYTPDDLNVFQVLASQAALAIENAQFYEQAQEMQGQIAQAEKMATIGTMADGLSHQINNRFYALSLIAGDTIDTIKMMDTSKCTAEMKEMIESVSHALERIQSNVVQGGEVVRGLLKYSRKGDAGFEDLDLNAIIDGTLEMVQFKVKLSEIDIIRDYKDIPKIKGNMAQLEEAFFNFIDNAYDAIVERRTTLLEAGYRGKITISAQPKDGNLEIIVQDNGMGIKDDNNQKVFTPFFTTKTSSRKGTGLGLYVIRKIITDTHHGKIAFESEHQVGTRFILQLPIAR